MNISRTTSNNPQFLDLVVELDKELWNRNTDIQQEYDQYNKIDELSTVVVAYFDSEPVGCGCFKPFSTGTVEIKRMYVKPAYRGKGVSKLILNELEKWAFEAGNRFVVLETGYNQFEAIGLYTRLGYIRIENFGQYKDMPNSICFSKSLSSKTF